MHATVTPSKRKLRSGSGRSKSDQGERPSSRPSSSLSPIDKVDDWLRENKRSKVSPSRSAVRCSSMESNASVLGGLGNDWEAVYDRKALLARMGMEVSIADKYRGRPDLLMDYNSILEIKFFSKEEGQDEPKEKVYDVSTELNEVKSAFEEHLTLHAGIKFPKLEDLPKEYLALRDEVKKDISLYKMEYKRGQGWSSGVKTEDLSSAPPQIKSSMRASFVVGALRRALLMDMRNGDGKNLFEYLHATLSASIGPDVSLVVKSSRPALQEGANSQVELVALEDSINYNRPYKARPIDTYSSQETRNEVEGIPACDLLLYDKRTPRVEVPDITWTMPTGDRKGIFLLNVKLKPDGLVQEAIFQCCKQIISKLHFQDFIIGLVITPLRYCFILAYKNDGTICMSRFVNIFVQSSNNRSSSGPFDVQSFCEMMDMLARILLYAKLQMQ